jgi:hypothetical protein
VTPSALEIADLIRTAGAAFVERNRPWIRWKLIKVLLAIARCRTAEKSSKKERKEGLWNLTLPQAQQQRSIYNLSQAAVHLIRLNIGLKDGKHLSMSCRRPLSWSRNYGPKSNLGAIYWDP